MKKIILSKDEINTLECGSGLIIGIEGFKGNPVDAQGIYEQIYIEYWEGKIRIHVWNGEQDAKTLEIDKLEKESI